jgi:hypothetical protein
LLGLLSLLLPLHGRVSLIDWARPLPLIIRHWGGRSCFSSGRRAVEVRLGGRDGEGNIREAGSRPWCCDREEGVCVQRVRSSSISTTTPVCQSPVSRSGAVQTLLHRQSIIRPSPANLGSVVTLISDHGHPLALRGWSPVRFEFRHIPGLFSWTGSSSSTYHAAFAVVRLLHWTSQPVPRTNCLAKEDGPPMVRHCMGVSRRPRPGRLAPNGWLDEVGYRVWLASRH